MRNCYGVLKGWSIRKAENHCCKDLSIVEKSKHLFPVWKVCWLAQKCTFLFVVGKIISSPESWFLVMVTAGLVGLFSWWYCSLGPDDLNYWLSTVEYFEYTFEVFELKCRIHSQRGLSWESCVHALNPWAIFPAPILCIFSFFNFIYFIRMSTL